ncbi:MAG: M20/M25/M40 family metallo-hydrolase [Gemmatimonadales bacterium]
MSGLSLIYRWDGADPSLPPLVLMGHFDVVPVPGAESQGVGARTVLGRHRRRLRLGPGTLDDKTTVLSILEAVEGLLARGSGRPGRCT